MAITAETRKSIVQLVVTAYNAAPGTALLTELVNDSVGGSSLADIATKLTTSTTFNSIYPTFQTSTEFATEFLGKLVPEASAAALAEGIAVVEGVLNGGGTRADVILQAQTFLAALSETDASFGSSAANFNNKVEVAEHHTITLELDSANITDLQNVLSTVTSDDATVQPAKDSAATSGGQQGQTITLTTGADAITGSAADDLIVATEATLSSADVLDGGAGTDTLRYASSGAAAVSESGFESKNIEIVSVTSDAVGGTTFDMSGVAGATTVRNFNSSQNLTVSGLGAVTNVTLDNVGSPDNTVMPATTVNYNAAATVGTNTQNVSLISNSNANGGTIGTLTANGIENFALTTSGGASGLMGIASTSLDTVTVAGDQNLTISGMLVGADTVTATGFTGNLSVVLDSAGTAKDVSVTGGTGNDRANFSAGFEKDDSFDGGDGTDTLGVLNAVATGTPAGTLANVEILDITDAATGTVDMDNFAGVTKVILNAGIVAAGTSTIDDAVSGIEVELDENNTGSLVVDLKTDGTADEITVTVDRIVAAHSITSINAADAETLNISFDDDSTANTTASFTVTSLTASDATTLNLSGDAATTITNTVDPTTAVLTKVDASTMTGALMLAGTNFSSKGATVMLGSGGDTLTMATASGADTITLGGGKDTVVYNAVAQSDSDTDTITDFVSGTDKLSFQFANPVLNFRGNKESFGQSQGSLSGGAAPAAGLDAVYQVDDQILWIDINDDGTLDNNDFRIKLTGVTALTTADIGLAATGNTVTLSAAAANVGLTGTPTNADKNTTNFADTIKSTIPFVAGSTIAGGLGTDTLQLTTAGTIAVPATVTATEVLQLATVSTTANVVTFAGAAQFTSVTGSSNADTITTANMVASATGSITGGAGADNITLSADLAGATIDAGDDADTVNTGAVTVTTTLKGGAGTDNLIAGGNISGATVSGFETATLTGATVTPTQYNSLGTITNAGTVTMSTAGTVTGAVGTVALAAGANTVTVAANGATVSGNTGNDAITLGVTLGNFTYAEGAAGGTDSLTLNVDNAGALTVPALIETFSITAAQTTSGAVTNGANVTVFDSSSISSAITLDTTATTATSTKFGSGADTLTATGANTATHVIELGGGADTITGLTTGAGAMTVDWGEGNGTLTDIAVKGAGVLTMKFGTPATGDTNTIDVVGTTANFAVNDVFDFVGAVTGIVNGQANGTNGIANGVGQVFVDSVTNAANTIITFDADGSRTFTTGDTQIVIVGNVLTAGVTGGNLVITGSA